MEKKKKNQAAAGVIVAVFIWVYIALYIIHVCIVMDDTGCTLTDALGPGMNALSEGPLAIFPLPENCIIPLLLVTVCYILIVLAVKENIKNNRVYDPKTVHGDSGWLEGKELEEYYRTMTYPKGTTDYHDPGNIILAKNFALAIDDEWTHRNANGLIIGGSGSGKSFFYLLPNILQAYCNYVFTDPSGELFHKTGKILEYFGHHISCFNADDMEKSSHYNPFNYIFDDIAVASMATAIAENTSDGSKNGDQFWIDYMKQALTSYSGYLHEFAPKDRQTLPMIMNMIMAANIDENDASRESRLDQMFKEAEAVNPQSFAVQQYNLFKKGAGKTLKSVMAQCVTRLYTLLIPQVIDLLSSDEIHLDRIGDEPTALYICVPSTNTTFHYLASLMYTQLFSTAFHYAQTTAKYSQNLVDGSGRVIRAYRAENAAQSGKVRRRVQQLLSEFKETGRIVYNEDFNWYELRTGSGYMLGHRGSRQEAEKAMSLIKKGSVQSNTKQSHDGERLPIFLRCELDEYPSTNIPGFPNIQSQIRKFAISADVIIQSMAQLQYKHKDEWETLSSNCSNVVYLGGGLDDGTTKWLSAQVGMETRRTKSRSKSNTGGSSTTSETGEVLFSQAQFRTLGGIKRDKCIVMAPGINPYIGDKYPTQDHPNYDLMRKLNKTPDWKEFTPVNSIDKAGIKAESLGHKLLEFVTHKKEKQDPDGEDNTFISEGYVFNRKKEEYLSKMYEMPLPGEEEHIDHGEKLPESKDAETKRRRLNAITKQKAESYQKNRDENGNPIASDAVTVWPEAVSHTQPLTQDEKNRSAAVLKSVQKEVCDSSGKESDADKAAKKQAEVIVETTTGWWSRADNNMHDEYGEQLAQGIRTGSSSGVA